MEKQESQKPKNNIFQSSTQSQSIFQSSKYSQNLPLSESKPFTQSNLRYTANTQTENPEEYSEFQNEEIMTLQSVDLNQNDIIPNKNFIDIQNNPNNHQQQQQSENNQDRVPFADITHKIRPIFGLNQLNRMSIEEFQNNSVNYSNNINNNNNEFHFQPYSYPYHNNLIDPYNYTDSIEAINLNKNNQQQQQLQQQQQQQQNNNEYGNMYLFDYDNINYNVNDSQNSNISQEQEQLQYQQVQFLQQQQNLYEIEMQTNNKLLPQQQQQIQKISISTISSFKTSRNSDFDSFYYHFTKKSSSLFNIQSSRSSQEWLARMIFDTNTNINTSIQAQSKHNSISSSNDSKQSFKENVVPIAIQEQKSSIQAGIQIRVDAGDSCFIIDDENPEKQEFHMPILLHLSNPPQPEQTDKINPISKDVVIILDHNINLKRKLKFFDNLFNILENGQDKISLISNNIQKLDKQFNLITLSEIVKLSCTNFQYSDFEDIKFPEINLRDALTISQEILQNRPIKNDQTFIIFVCDNLSILKQEQKEDEKETENLEQQQQLIARLYKQFKIFSYLITFNEKLVIDISVNLPKYGIIPYFIGAKSKNLKKSISCIFDLKNNTLLNINNPGNYQDTIIHPTFQSKLILQTDPSFTLKIHTLDRSFDQSPNNNNSNNSSDSSNLYYLPLESNINTKNNIKILFRISGQYDPKIHKLNQFQTLLNVKCVKQNMQYHSTACIPIYNQDLKIMFKTNEDFRVYSYQVYFQFFLRYLSLWMEKYVFDMMGGDDNFPSYFEEFVKIFKNSSKKETKQCMALLKKFQKIEQFDKGYLIMMVNMMKYQIPIWNQSIIQ